MSFNKLHKKRPDIWTSISDRMDHVLASEYAVKEKGGMLREEFMKLHSLGCSVFMDPASCIGAL